MEDLSGKTNHMFINNFIVPSNCKPMVGCRSTGNPSSNSRINSNGGVVKLNKAAFKVYIQKVRLN